MVHHGLSQSLLHFAQQLWFGEQACEVLDVVGYVGLEALLAIG